MRKLLLLPVLLVVLLLAPLEPAAAQSVEPFIEAGSAQAAGLSSEEYAAVCATLPRACSISRKNAKFSYWNSVQGGGGWVIKGLSAKEWRQ